MMYRYPGNDLVNKDVETPLGYDWYYHHSLLVLLHHDSLHNSFSHSLQRMEIPVKGEVGREGWC
jgi:hypothetical protein